MLLIYVISCNRIFQTYKLRLGFLKDIMALCSWINLALETALGFCWNSVLMDTQDDPSCKNGHLASIVTNHIYVECN